MGFSPLHRTALKRGCVGCLKFGLARRSWQLTRFACATEAPTSLAMAILIRASVRILVSHVMPNAQEEAILSDVQHAIQWIGSVVIG